MLSSCSLLQSAIPNNTGPFSDTTMKMHQYPMPLLIMVMHLFLFVECRSCYIQAILSFSMALFSFIMFWAEKEFLHPGGH